MKDVSFVSTVSSGGRRSAHPTSATQFIGWTTSNKYINELLFSDSKQYFKKNCDPHNLYSGGKNEGRGIYWAILPHWISHLHC